MTICVCGRMVTETQHTREIFEFQFSTNGFYTTINYSHYLQGDWLMSYQIVVIGF